MTDKPKVSLAAIRERLQIGSADRILPLIPSDESIFNLVDRTVADKAIPQPPQSTNNPSAADILQRIRNRSDGKASSDADSHEQILSKDWSVVQVKDHPNSFFLRTWSEKGKIALVYLLTNSLDIGVLTREGSSNLTITFNDLSQATYFKLKYAD